MQTKSRKVIVRATILGVLLAFGALTFFFVSAFSTTGRPDILDIPPAFADVEDSRGNIRNINATVSLQLEERTARHYDIDAVHTIVTTTLQSINAHTLEEIYDIRYLQTLLHHQLNQYINPAHLLGVLVTDISTGIHPILPELQRPPRPRGNPIWIIN